MARQTHSGMTKGGGPYGDDKRCGPLRDENVVAIRETQADRVPSNIPLSQHREYVISNACAKPCVFYLKPKT